MNDVKRFDCTNGGAKWCQGCYQMTEHPQGDYVSAEDYAALEAEARALRQQVADRSIWIVPERMVKTERSSDEYDMCADHWNACLDELARINGMTVGEGLVQGMAKFAREIICGALDGGSFDGADIQESAERHGLIAKQVMNEPCRGPEEYCACAWSTSFPTECYRITAELRALLNQDKENGNG